MHPYKHPPEDIQRQDVRLSASENHLHPVSHTETHTKSNPRRFVLKEVTGSDFD